MTTLRRNQVRLELRRRALAFCATLAVVATLAAWSPKVLHRGATPQTKKASANPSKYEKWLDQDVVYIITPLERARFKKLKTDSDRDKFIEQFWERRSPDPGSTVNAYKQEHCRRIAYANQHFAFGSKAGWRTDRGSVLIVYGPPDEIDSHPKGEPYPYENWKYRYLAGIGENAVFVFADRSHTGDLKLIRQPKLYPLPKSE